MRGVTSDPFNASFARLRLAWWPVVQAALASGLAWYVTHDALGHPQPFFAPIAAAISLSAFVGRRVMRDEDEDAAWRHGMRVRSAVRSSRPAEAARTARRVAERSGGDVLRRR
jgi:hypothetical protein